jgi:mono/diheme cytochrome c family protein
MSVRNTARIASALALLWLALSPVQAGAAAASAATEGQALFREKCGVCHLAGGGGTWMLGRRHGPEKALLEQRSDLLPLYVRYVARHGINSMPRFTRVELSDAQLEAIATYLTTPKPAAAGSP